MSNFVCEHCGMVNIDCGKEGYKTPKEIVLEETLDKIKVIAEDITRADLMITMISKAQEIIKLTGEVK